MSATDAQGRIYHFNEQLDARGSDKPWPGVVMPVDDAQNANLLGSLGEDGLHRPCIDIDQAARLVPSSTPGHFHLYLDAVSMPWDGYLALLDALVSAGVVSAKYVEHVRERGQSFVRPEWAKKESL